MQCFYALFFIISLCHWTVSFGSQTSPSEPYVKKAGVINLTEPNEFKIIRQFFTNKQTSNQALIQGIGDDCAVIKSTAQLAISVDTSIAGVHFPIDEKPYDIGARALNVALSDLAAMGAKPRYFTLAMSLPALDETWLSAFSDGLFDAANTYNIQLIGGDTTRTYNQKNMQFSVSVFGELPEGKGLYRAKAKVGDYIYVSGERGDAALGLATYFEEKKHLTTNKGSPA